ncbi:Sua5/YciO/YrdC/YwlC family protein [Necropsobacter rosorum]|uniref:Sua5/YciO/YrdC/YwlC family protein n=1 Tax=Necropsobacter rosorum TaxID=908285 RepID=UPI00050968B7
MNTQHPANVQYIVEQLKHNQVVAYPTEAVFGLGCNPLNESAVQKLLVLKQRPVEKGLILVAPTLSYLQPFINIAALDAAQLQRLTARYDRPTTWLVPAAPGTPAFLTGRFDSIAIRLCRHEAVRLLCEQTGFALISTSANLSGLPPCRTAQEVKAQFGADFPVLEMATGQAENPSTIRDLLTNQVIRQG